MERLDQYLEELEEEINNIRQLSELVSSIDSYNSEIKKLKNEINAETSSNFNKTNDLILGKTDGLILEIKNLDNNFKTELFPQCMQKIENLCNGIEGLSNQAVKVKDDIIEGFDYSKEFLSSEVNKVTNEFKNTEMRIKGYIEESRTEIIKIHKLNGLILIIGFIISFALMFLVR